MQVNIELTDTYGGEANYSWVRRESFEIADDATDRAIVRRAKALLGLTGSKATRRDSWCNHIALWGLDGACVVLFIELSY